MSYAVYHIAVDKRLDSGYIGITKNIDLRWSQHRWNRKNSNPHLRAALLKHKDQLKFSVVADGLDFETAKWVESILRPFAEMGWNIAKGGQVPPSPKGKKRSEKYRSNISIAKMGEKNPMFGKKVVFSESHRKNLSKALIGKPRPIAQGKSRPTMKCPYCGKSGGDGAMVRWHFERCKNYEA